MAEIDACIETLARLVAYPTVSAVSNCEIIAYLAERLIDAGARVEVLQDESGGKANLWATLGPEESGGLVLSGHTDVVPVEGQDWSSDPFVLSEAGGRLYGRGTCDMKGFIAAVLTALPAFRGKGPIHLAFTHDEEVGCIGARALVDVLGARDVRPAMAIIGEPTQMRVIDGHKGCCEYSVHFRGQAGHGSRPDLGVNAVEYALRYAAHLMAMRDTLAANPPRDSRFEPPWTTINMGALHGGTAHNIIAEHAQLDWEMRPVDWADALRVTTGMERYCAEDLVPAMQRIAPDAGIRTEIVGETLGLEPRTENRVRDLVARVLAANGTDLVSFGTEAGLFQALGLDVIVCGPGAIEQAHKADEYVEVSQLQRAIDMLHGVAARL